MSTRWDRQSPSLPGGLVWASRVDPPEKFTVWVSEALFTQQTMTVAAIHPPIHPSASVRCCRRRWERTSPASPPPPTQWKYCRPPHPPPPPSRKHDRAYLTQRSAQQRTRLQLFFRNRNPSSPNRREPVNSSESSFARVRSGISPGVWLVDLVGNIGCRCVQAQQVRARRFLWLRCVL